MKKVDCLIRPYQLEEIKTALTELGVQGMTVSEARGAGSSPPAKEGIGLDYVIRLPVRMRLEMVVPDEMVEPIIEAVLRHAQTEQADDGKIFVYPVIDAARIRTEERSDAAL